MKIYQYLHRPNQTELGLGNTHETYILVKTEHSGLSVIFPDSKEVEVADRDKRKNYTLKAAIGNEYRINQLGPLYRDYEMNPGDEIIFTAIVDNPILKVTFTVKKFKRVILRTSKNDGTEILNIDLLKEYSDDRINYKIPLTTNEGQKQLNIKFKESKNKRNDSPNPTDFYEVTIDNKPLSPGNHYISLTEQPTMSDFPKSEFNCIEIDDIDSILPDKKGKQENSVNVYKGLQRIFYGAPGTGKSFMIKKLTNGEEVIRTTFHPDSDYSTFVGCYKPTTVEVPMRDVTGKVIYENGKKVTETRIVYNFVSQAFMQAYVQAWKFYANVTDEKEVKRQYLIIEEINRGNCAQIFGDLFQLLDRNEGGFSDYYIHADYDMKSHLAKEFNELSITQKEKINNLYEEDVVDKVLSGEILLLPNNLYIWATMNTSDQSLFPIDSAFKRRWDWEYVPIADAPNESWKVIVGENSYDWWDFVQKINVHIYDTTKSADKQLGYFFCKAKHGIIDGDTFVNKVVFYLWNDVFKDFGFDDAIFDDEETEEKSKLTFDKFFQAASNGNTIVNIKKVVTFLDNLGVKKVQNDAPVLNKELSDESDNIENDVADRDYSKYSINGEGEYNKRETVKKSIELFISSHPEMTGQEIVDNIKTLEIKIPRLIQTEPEYLEWKRRNENDLRQRAEKIQVGENDIIYVSNQIDIDRINDFIEKVNQQSWGIHIEKVD